ncbi:hypothetical protein, variant [Phytophthora nicotianae P10297]|uniref:Uncharacterized protein n=3 Tax=Phytophthora nicotianae TaxID=4792 RepID=W2Q2Z5_PHYN3|nr:hypothetical protein, variant [Phytophthora nicotianae INRA-310]ETN06889.1 hypothetical protein, variant [Phytophthora nicotianae INRA-310]ETO71992.1 hypothetical protein F444_11770 [Phytophthora nicotianae P1976]ETP41209.1 hypothetical protein, variant [Phytophthora nicotianae P10297]
MTALPVVSLIPPVVSRHCVTVLALLVRSWSCAAAAVSVVVSDASSFEPVQQWCFIANVALLVSLCLVQNYYTESFNVVFEIHDSSSYEHFQRHGSTFLAYK